MNSYLADLIKKHEGLRLKPYTCSEGKLTIGYGHNLTDKGISEDQAEYLLMHDILDAERDLTKIFNLHLLHELSDIRYAVLVDMMFNLGLTRFKSFNNMIEAVKTGDHERVCREMKDSRWYYQVKGRAKELIKLYREG